MGEEMYFIVEGSVYVIAADKHTVINTLGKGRYFGEIAIFLESKRTAYVQAETFCIISILRKKDLDHIVQSFPNVAEEFKNEGARRLKFTTQLQQEVESDDGDITLSPDVEETHRLKKDYGTPEEGRSANLDLLPANIKKQIEGFEERMNAVLKDRNSVGSDMASVSMDPSRRPSAITGGGDQINISININHHSYGNQNVQQTVTLHDTPVISHNVKAQEGETEKMERANSLNGTDSPAMLNLR